MRLGFGTFVCSINQTNVAVCRDKSMALALPWISGTEPLADGPRREAVACPKGSR